MKEQRSSSDIRLAARVRQRFVEVLRERTAEGLYPHEGQWLSREQIEERIRTTQRLGWRRSVELLLVFTVINIISIAALLMLWRMVY